MRHIECTSCVFRFQFLSRPAQRPSRRVHDDSRTCTDRTGRLDSGGSNLADDTTRCS
jgi:hypothetical protein